MPRVTCRCGEKLKVPTDAPDRIDCPKCGAKVRLRRRDPLASLQGVGETDDGYLRFLCPCGRRLKVLAADRPGAGKCPDCGRVVPVPESAWAVASKPGAGRGDPEARTDEMDAVELARIAEWTDRHLAASAAAAGSTTNDDAPAPGGSGSALGLFSPNVAPPSMVKFEAGLRVCPRCGKPVHLSATNCRECGSPVPRR